MMAVAAANDAGDPGTGLEETCRACVWGCCSSVRETREPWGVAMRGVLEAEVAVLAFVAVEEAVVVGVVEEEEDVDEEV